MSETENTAVTPDVVDEDHADVVDITKNQPALRWDSEEARDAFLAEADKREQEGKSLKGMDLPVEVTGRDE